MTVHTSLDLTGERTVPDIPEENYWFRRHEAAYDWVASTFSDEITDGVVLDAGCGEGYGVAALGSLRARTCIGLELDPATAAHAHHRYGAGISVVRTNLDALPIRSDSVDLLVSMQVVEHLWNLHGFLTDCRRVLSDAGIAVLTTPNRLTFSPGLERGEKPTNPFHVEEFDAEQLTQRVAAAGFTNVECLGLAHGERLSNWERDHGSIVAAQVAAATAGSSRSIELQRAVSAVAARDFTVRDEATADCLDLVVIARAQDPR